MRVMLININCGVQSTGRICADLAEMIINRGGAAEVAYGRDEVPDEYKHLSYKIGNSIDVYIHVLASRLFDAAGKGSIGATKKLVRHIKEYNPDIVHLHNIHGYYLNTKVLFDYLSKAGKPVVWTFHDCWAFTGHCSHYSLAGCEKWKTGCFACAQKKSYPRSFLIDQSRKNYLQKKRLFDIDGLHIVTVSKWLNKQVSQSFLRHKDIRTISNGIDLNVYHKVNEKTKLIPSNDSRTKILAVSSFWFKGKGLYDYIDLAKKLDDSFAIYMVGEEPSETEIPANISFLGTVNSKEEMIKIYSTCDVFVNFSYQETFSLVTLEAMACGLPVLVYDATAVPEVVGNNGKIIHAGDIDAALEYLKEGNYIMPDPDAIEEYSIEKNREKYLELYHEILGMVQER